MFDILYIFLNEKIECFDQSDVISFIESCQSINMLK